jgi:hypothetical protein
MCNEDHFQVLVADVELHLRFTNIGDVRMLCRRNLCTFWISIKCGLSFDAWQCFTGKLFWLPCHALYMGHRIQMRAKAFLEPLTYPDTTDCLCSR